MSRVDRRDIDRMTVEQLRAELVWMWEQHLALIEAFHELPKIPSRTALHALSAYAVHSRDHDLGKRLQREASIDEIPPNSEAETGAGLWARIRPALLNQDNQ